MTDITYFILGLAIGALCGLSTAVLWLWAMVAPLS